MLKSTKHRIKILKAIAPYLYGIKRFILLLSAADFAAMLIAITIPYFYKMLIDDIIVARNLSPIRYVVLGYSSLFLLRSAIEGFMNYSRNRLCNRFGLNVRLRILKNVLSMAPQKHNKMSPGDLEMRLNSDSETLTGFLPTQTYTLCTALITVLCSGALLFAISPLLALYAILIIPITFYLSHLIGRAEEDLMKERRKIAGAYNTWLHESLQGWKEIRALGQQKRETRRFTHFTHLVAIFRSRWIYYWVLQELVIPKIKDEFLMGFSLYFFGGILIMKGHFSIGDLILFIQYYGIFYKNINTLGNSNVELSKNAPLYDRALKALVSPSKTHGIHPTGIKGNILLKNLSYGYAKELGTVLDDLTFEIQGGQCIAIVGKSGSGKTTLAKLMLGLMPADRGDIHYDGVKLREINTKAFHRQVGAAMQDGFLFNLSILENLKMAKAEASEIEIITACKKAGLDDFIQSLPHKYDTIIGEKGVKLSGGQRQKLVLARLFLMDPEVIILDEATSALDSISEDIIHHHIKKTWADKTVILIAHRLSSVLLSDKVLVLKNGKIAGFDHHSNLVSQNKAYDDLFAKQYVSA